VNIVVVWAVKRVPLMSRARKIRKWKKYGGSVNENFVEHEKVLRVTCEMSLSLRPDDGQ